MTYKLSHVHVGDGVSRLAITLDGRLECVLGPYEGRTPEDLDHAYQLLLRLELTHGVPTEVLEQLIEQRFTQRERHRMLAVLRYFVQNALRLGRPPTRHLGGAKRECAQPGHPARVGLLEDEA